MVNSSIISWIVSWFVVGLISVATIWISDMRGKEFNKDYFDSEIVTLSIILIVLGYVTPFIVYSLFTSEKKYFTRLIYNISNIGLKKTKVEE